MKNSVAPGLTAVSLQMTVFILLGTFSNASYSSLSVFIQPSYSISYTQVGFITSVTFLGNLTVFFLVGILVDRMGAKSALRISFGLIALGSFIAFLSSMYFELLIGYYIIGFGYGIIIPATNRIVMDTYYPHHSTVMGIKQAGAPIGLAMAAIILPAIAFRYSLSYSFLALTAGALISMVFVGRNSREKSSSSISLSKSLRELFRTMIGNRVLVAVSATSIFLSWGQQTVFTYYALFMQSIGYHAETAVIFLFIVMTGAIFGRIMWMKIGDRYFGTDRVGALSMITFFSGLMILIFPYLSSSPVPAGIMAFLLGLNGISWTSMFVTAISELAPKDKVGLYSGIGLIFLSMGVIVGTPVEGWIKMNTSFFGLWIVLGAGLLIGSLLLGTAVRRIYKRAISIT